jgi:hypothetical protein
MESSLVNFIVAIDILKLNVPLNWHTKDFIRNLMRRNEKKSKELILKLERPKKKIENKEKEKKLVDDMLDKKQLCKIKEVAKIALKQY